MREEKGKYTPGPWEGERSIFAGERQVAVVMSHGWQMSLNNEDLANARLIAAAPELLEALKLSMLIHDTVKSEYGPDPGQRLVIEAAIAKAEGR